MFGLLFRMLPCGGNADMVLRRTDQGFIPDRCDDLLYNEGKYRFALRKEVFIATMREGLPRFL